jgi:hypothetical protein
LINAKAIETLLVTGTESSLKDSKGNTLLHYHARLTYTMHLPKESKTLGRVTMVISGPQGFVFCLNMAPIRIFKILKEIQHYVRPVDTIERIGG